MQRLPIIGTDCVTVGKEDEGTPHLQGAVSFTSGKTYVKVLKIFGGSAGGFDIRPADGTPQQAHSYGMKGKSPKWNPEGKGGKPVQSTMWSHHWPGEDWQGWYSGEFPLGQGHDEDFNEVCRELREGTLTYRNILEQWPMGCQQYGRTFKDCAALGNRLKRRSEMTEGLWYWGASGTGKTHKAMGDIKSPTWSDDYYVVNSSDYARGWMQGYEGQETVVFNEFRGNQSGCPFRDLMELVDQWPHTVCLRNIGGVPFLAKRFIITAPKSPEDTYPTEMKGGEFGENQEDPKQFHRRFKVIEFTETMEHRQAKRQKVKMEKIAEAMEEFASDSEGIVDLT